MRNDFGVAREADTIGVSARAVNIVGIDGERLEIEIVIERGVVEFDEVAAEACADDGQTLAGKIAEDQGIAEGLAGVDGEFVDIAEKRSSGGGGVGEIEGRGVGVVVGVGIGVGGVGGEIGVRRESAVGKREKEKEQENGAKPHRDSRNTQRTTPGPEHGRIRQEMRGSKYRESGRG
ncbi:MAG: hypothetical protein WAK48_08940 [Candidatus Acidiferrum sp.]